MSRFPSAQLAKGNTDNIAIAMASVPPSQKLQEFLRFPDLPMEIRFKIWKLSLPGKDLTEAFSIDSKLTVEVHELS
jgi:hypothetical protein